MDVKTLVLPVIETDADTILGYCFEDERELMGAADAINKAMNGAVLELMDSGDFAGKPNQTIVLYPREAAKARRVVLVGLGKVERFTADTLRRSAATGIRKARELKARRVATTLAGIEPGGLSRDSAARAIVEGALLGRYEYRGQKTTPAPEESPLPDALEVLVFQEDYLPEVDRGTLQGMAFAAGTMLARDLVNMPPNLCTPDYLAQRAKDIAESAGLRCEALQRGQIEALRMGALLAVARGSETPPRFIILEHNAERTAELDTIVLVGKGVTFDTGGYTIKTGEGMVGMKADMAGAAAVIGAMGTIAALDVPLHVVGLIPAADNMISGSSYRPQEVITASNGKTIEIISTDAEGRLLLADALVYAKRYNPAAVVDIATLTGACVVALGSGAAGLFSTDDGLRDALMEAGISTGERVWPLPMFPEYEKLIDSQTADMKNSGGRNAGASIGAVFLKNFVDYPVWAHIDMTGMMLDAEGNPYIPVKGGTGYGARLLAEFVQQWAERQPASTKSHSA
ncbi:MAG: leucyl aminopeptidase [bacterium]|nr:leucyl aminopeptidase [bacterium]